MTAHDIDLAALGRYDTPTICNALLAVAPEAARHSTKAMLQCAQARRCRPWWASPAPRSTARRSPAGLDAAEGERAQDLAWFDYVSAGARAPHRRGAGRRHPRTPPPTRSSARS